MDFPVLRIFVAKRKLTNRRATHVDFIEVTDPEEMQRVGAAIHSHQGGIGYYFAAGSANYKVGLVKRYEIVNSGSSNKSGGPKSRHRIVKAADIAQIDPQHLNSILSEEISPLVRRLAEWLLSNTTGCGTLTQLLTDPPRSPVEALAGAALALDDKNKRVHEAVEASKEDVRRAVELYNHYSDINLIIVAPYPSVEAAKQIVENIERTILDSIKEQMMADIRKFQQEEVWEFNDAAKRERGLEQARQHAQLVQRI